MTRIAIIGLLTLLLGQTMQAQENNYQVRGVVADSLTNETEPYSTIRIISTENKEKPVKMGVTGNDGKFEIPLPEAGDYHISISSVGKKNIERDFTLTKQHVLDLGVLLTSESTEVLKAVEVVALKPLVKADIDKITYNIEDDPDATTNTTLEMLRKVPLITIDSSEQIQLNGSSNFRVYLNGKPNAMMSSNPREVLRGLPANSVKAIEVITDPGARYDAEGIGGILNIITNKEKKIDSYNATISAGANNDGLDAGFYGTVQSGKFAVSAQYSYVYYNQPHSNSSTEREDLTSPDMNMLKSKSRYKTKYDMQYATLDASYEMDTMNLINISASLIQATFKIPEEQTVSLTDKTGPVYSYKSINNAKEPYISLDTNVDYQHSFKKKGEYLTLSYKFYYSPRNTKSETTYEDIVNVPFKLQNQQFEDNTHTTEHTAQIDYVNPISKKHYIDFGAKYILRTNASDSKKYYADPISSTMTLYDDAKSQYSQTRNILAAYADYQLKIKEVTLKAGVRYEHTFMDVKYDLLPSMDYRTQFDNVVPDASIAYTINNHNNLRLNYNMRINRPSIWYLNPFRNTSNPTSISYGNPDLDTEKAHNFSLRYSLFTAKFSINATLSYMLTNNSIESYSIMNNGIMETTYSNISKVQKTTLSLWMNWNIGKKTRITLNGSGSYNDYSSIILNTYRHGFTGNLYGNIQQNLPWKLLLTINGNITSRRLTLQGKTSGYGYFGVGLRRTFLKDNSLTVSITTSSPFTKNITIHTDRASNSFKEYAVSTNPIRVFGIDVSWRFGKQNAQVKTISRKIVNDDVKAGGSTGGVSL